MLATSSSTLAAAPTVFELMATSPWEKTEAEGAGIPFSVVWSFIKSRGAFFTLIFTGYLCLSTQGW